jgi:VanZ family protein
MVKRNILSILEGLLIMYLSLTGSDTFKKVPIYNIPHLDKIIHFGMYFTWMTLIAYENRKNIKSTPHLIFIAIIPFCFGFLMEVLQFYVVTSRSGSVYDMLANSAGIIISILLWIWIKPLIKEKIR